MSGVQTTTIKRVSILVAITFYVSSLNALVNVVLNYSNYVSNSSRISFFLFYPSLVLFQSLHVLFFFFYSNLCNPVSLEIKPPICPPNYIMMGNVIAALVMFTGKLFPVKEALYKAHHFGTVVFNQATIALWLKVGKDCGFS